MIYRETALEGAMILEPQLFNDERGYFMETFRSDDFKSHCADVDFVQDNQSSSVKGILRGLHYQVNKPQGKLVRVISGEVFDVAVDLRRSSKTFGQWVGVYLSAENKRQFWIPEGFAHGFLVTSDRAEFVYKCTNYYSPTDERGVAWNCPEVDIDWPLDDIIAPVLSAKDSCSCRLSQAEVFK
ncbi:MAG: dTDP-4-dehydrorhamnose 3,5-epimerase [Kangiellaceae bacterium]|nr:dTDP-4-dehydrorhamnose 3,5-epimerase [Kangiellaceae bacterium]|tara:strand:+ start:603 stop:1151 length:549 start_codon:yes stop_codon:yes gene_type:complete